MGFVESSLCIATSDLVTSLIFANSDPNWPALRRGVRELVSKLASVYTTVEPVSAIRERLVQVL